MILREFLKVSAPADHITVKNSNSPNRENILIEDAFFQWVSSKANVMELISIHEFISWLRFILSRSSHDIASDLEQVTFVQATAIPMATNSSIATAVLSGAVATPLHNK